MGLKEVLTEWLKHQIEVLVRRSQHRLDKIDARMELPTGYIIAFLNLDRVIEIIRSEDEPKAIRRAEFQPTDRQAEANINMPPGTLRKLEAMQVRRKGDKRSGERDGQE